MLSKIKKLFWFLIALLPAPGFAATITINDVAEKQFVQIEGRTVFVEVMLDPKKEFSVYL